MTSSRYVNRGLTYGLEEWRSNEWTWESFGEMVPVKNQDLWQRLDHALQFHQLDVRPIRLDGPHALRGPYSEMAVSADAPAVESSRRELRGPHFPLPNRSAEPAKPQAAAVEPKAVRRAPLAARVRHRLRDWSDRAKLSLAQLGTAWLPRPWLG
jgi:hypothetical protein